jgi:hypothetical protein
MRAVLEKREVLANTAFIEIACVCNRAGVGFD